MAHILCCGFECGVSGTSGGEHWEVLTNASFSTSTVRTGTRSMRANPTAASSSIRSYSVSGGNIGVLRVYVNFASLPTSDMMVAYIDCAGRITGALFRPSDSKIYAGEGSTFGIGASGVSVTTGQWYRIDIRCDGTTNPILVDVQVDGTACGQFSYAVAGGSWGRVWLASSGTNTFDMYFDDLVASSTSGDYPIGAGYVNHFIPTSDGTHSGITSNDYERTLTGTDILNSTTDAYLLIDDVPLESGSGTDWINMVAPVANSYVECNFGPAPGISTPTTAPTIVSLIMGIHAAGTGTFNAEWRLVDNGSTDLFFGGTGIGGSTSIVYKRANYNDPPSAASTWTVGGGGNGDFNNLKIRFGAGGTVDANPDVYFDCIMLEAAFATVVTRTPRPTSIGHPFIM